MWWFYFDYLVLIFSDVNTRLLFLYTSIVLEVIFVGECCASHVRIIFHPANFDTVSCSFFVHGRAGIIFSFTGYSWPESTVHLSLYDYILACVLTSDILNIATSRI